MITKTRKISNSDDCIDSRDVIKRIAELTGQDSLDQEEKNELAALLALQEEVYTPNWIFGAQLIRDSYFVEAMRELYAKGFPAYIVIDWEATADNLRIDYTSVEFDGITYRVR